MRKKIVAGYWKCNTTVQEGVELAKAVTELVAKSGVKNVVCSSWNSFHPHYHRSFGC